MVTRRVNEVATVHAQSPIRTVNYLVLPHCCSVSWPPATPCNGNPKCKRGSYRTRPIAHPHGEQPGTPSLMLGQLAAGHAMRCDGNPTCKRGSYRTRLIAHPRGQLSGTPSLMHGQLAAGHRMVTRSVNEAATVHAQSPIRTVNYLVLPHCCSVSWPLATQCDGNPTCKRGSYSARPVAHPHGQLSALPH